MIDKIIVIDEQWNENLQAVNNLTKNYTKNKEVSALLLTSAPLDFNPEKSSI